MEAPMIKNVLDIVTTTELDEAYGENGPLNGGRLARWSIERWRLFVRDLLNEIGDASSLTVSADVAVVLDLAHGFDFIASDESFTVGTLKDTNISVSISPDPKGIIVG